MDEGSDEFIETSDLDELEEIQAKRWSYWQRIAISAKDIRVHVREDGYSPRKRVKLEHIAQELPSTPRRVASPLTCAPSFPRATSSSQSSSLLESTPSACLVVRSSSKSSSILATPPSHLNESNPPWDMMLHSYEENSQDPLLLYYPGVKQPCRPSFSRTGSLSPTNLPSVEPEADATEVLVFDPDEPPGAVSPFGGTHSPRSLSVDPLQLSRRLSPTIREREVVCDPSPRTPRATKFNGSPDSLLTPPKEPPSQMTSSSLTPPSTSRGEKAVRTVEGSPDANPTASSPTTHPVYQEEGSHNVPHDLANPARYSLRARQAKQLNPYAYDKILYKQQLRSNPDAIVKIVSPKRGGHYHGLQRDHGDEDAETHQYWEDEDVEDQTWEERRRAREKGQNPNTYPTDVQIGMNISSAQYPEALQDLPTTDEEEEKDRRALSKEARRMLREQRAKEAKAKTKGRKHARSFPLSKGSPPRRGADLIEPPGNHPGRLPYRSRGFRSATPDFVTREAPAADINSPVTSHGHYEDEVDLGGGFDKDQHNGMPEDIHRNTRNALVDNDDHNESDSQEHLVNHSYESDGASGSSEGSISGSDSFRVKDAKERKRLRAYKRMVPGVMVNRHFGKSHKTPRSVSKRQRSITIHSESEAEEVPLLPGQTKVRRAEHPVDIKDIRGDTESSEDELAVLSDNEVPAVETNLRPGKRRSFNIINLSDSEDGGASSNSGMDDDEIKAYLEDEMPRIRGRDNRTQIREESLIDWMLARTRTVGGQRKAREQGKRPAGNENGRRAHVRAGHKLDILTRGSRRHGTGRQTLLSFDKPLVATRSGQRTGYRPSSRVVNLDDDIPDKPDMNAYLVQEHASSKSAIKKKRKKEKRDRAKRQGLYTFTANGTRIISGRGRANAVTIDIMDDNFHRALAPLSQNGAKTSDRPHFKHRTTYKTRPPREPRLDTDVDGYLPADADIPLNHEELPRRDDQAERPSHDRRDIRRDFGIEFLPSGISFGPSTYIGRGWLHELVNLVSRVAEPPMPVAYTAFEFELGPHMSVQQFSTLLVDICNRLLECVNGLPDEDSTEQSKMWGGVMRVTCQLVSWFLAHSGEVDCTSLRGVVKEQVLHLVTCMQKLTLIKSAMDVMTFSLCWFAVELSARLGCRLPMQRTRPTETDPLVVSVSLLVQHLLVYGLKNTTEAIQDYDRTLDSLSTAQRTAELWICLLHLIDSYRPLDEQDKNHVHPLCQVVQEILQSDSPTESSLEASECIWRTIFSLCALSQFSVHGMTTSTSRLPPSWELAAFALTQIRLVAEPGDQTLPARSLDKRDEYIGLIAARCFSLWSHWHWRLDGTSVIFNQLVEIFRSRKFANLRQEPADFPAFILNSDLHLLAEFKPSDTAFVVFLKLIVLAAKTDGCDGNPGLTPKIKKLLSLAIPVGSVPFSKKTPPTVHELSMLYNRYSAVAVAIHLDPAAYRSRITHARSYVDFREADDTTRIACIRGMMYFSILMVQRQIPLDENLKWLEDMAEVLLNEHAKITDAIILHQKNMAKDREQFSIKARDRVVFLIPVLLGSARRIIETYGVDHSMSKDYPDPGLLSHVIRIFRNTHLVSVTNAAIEMRCLLRTFLDARAASMPVPQRPRILPSASLHEDSQESQDDYGTFELDLNDPDLIAALGDVVESSPVQERKAKDKVVCDIIDTQIYPVVYRLLCKCFRDCPSTVSFSDYCHDMDGWIDCWLSCANVVVQNGKKTWSMYLDRRTDSWGRITNDVFRRRVDLRVMLTLLWLDPMAYLHHNDNFIEVLLESLVSAKITIEHEYLSLVLSIDGMQHVLLRGIPCQPVPGTTDYKFTIAEFSTLRLQVLGAIFTNLDQSLGKVAPGDVSPAAPDNHKYVGFLTSMFKAMRSVYEQIEAGSEAQRVYKDWCQQVFQTIQRHLEVKSQERLLYWMNWGRTLE